MKLSDILKTSCKSFSMKFLEVNNFQINYLQYLQYWNTLLYCFYNNKAKIWACCCCKAWIAWLCWAWICWFCIMSWLCCHSRASLSLFCSCKSSDLNSRSCSSFSRRKPTTSYLNLQPVSLSSCSYVFMSLQFFPLLFFLIFWASFFHFRYQTVFFEYLLRFYVHFLQISLC